MENEVKQSTNSKLPKGLLVGVVLISIGIIFLGSNLGFIPQNLKHVLISWQMLLIVIGIGNYFKNKLFSGTILIMIGGFFLMPRIIENYPALFPNISINFVDLYWPFLLILAGILLIISKFCGPECNDGNWKHREPRCHKRNRHYNGEIQSEGFTKNSIFGGGDHIVLDPLFKGGEMNAIFGGITLDLRRTNLAEGETRLEVNAVFGGVTIFVPKDWFVETHMDAVFGGFQDNRQILDQLDQTKKLIITGACVFGGGELRN